ncbi:GCD complex subunit gcd7 [Sorochytrium milnesiophthora]
MTTSLRIPHVSGKVEGMLVDFIDQLRRRRVLFLPYTSAALIKDVCVFRQICGSHCVAEKTLEVLRQVVSSAKWPTVQVLIDLIKLIGKRFQDAQPIELAVGNTVRRVLHAIREDCLPAAKTQQPAERLVSLDHAPHSSIFNLFSEPDADSNIVDYSKIKSVDKKGLFVEAINELLEEMKSLHDSIAAQSLGHIHSNEIILTCGQSTTVERFFLDAAKKRTFQVIVVESAPSYSGHQLAATLAKAGIETTVIPDAAVFAVMSRVNKVILGAHAVLANGGTITVSGAANIATAAKHYSTPLVVLTGLYKLTPQHPFDLDAFNMLIAPAAIASYASDIAGQVDVINPYYDYIDPDMVSLLLTNEGSFTSSFVYRLLIESYHPDDTVLEPRPGAFDKFYAEIRQ